MSETQKFLLAGAVAVLAFMFFGRRSSGSGSGGIFDIGMNATPQARPAAPQVSIGQVSSSVTQPDSQFPILVDALRDFFEGALLEITNVRDQDHEAALMLAQTLERQRAANEIASQCVQRGGTLTREGLNYRCTTCQGGWVGSTCLRWGTVFEVPVP